MYCARPTLRKFVITGQQHTCMNTYCIADRRCWVAAARQPVKPCLHHSEWRAIAVHLRIQLPVALAHTAFTHCATWPGPVAVGDTHAAVQLPPVCVEVQLGFQPALSAVPLTTPTTWVGGLMQLRTVNISGGEGGGRAGAE